MNVVVMFVMKLVMEVMTFAQNEEGGGANYSLPSPLSSSP